MIKLKRCILISLATVSAGLGINHSAEAAVEGSLGDETLAETFSANYGTGSSPLVGGDSEDLSLSEFNPALGTLTGVTLTLISNDTIESEVINLVGQHCQNYTDATAMLPVSVTGLDGLTTTATGEAGPYSGMAKGPQFTTTVAGTAQVTTTTSAEAASGDFALYEGSGQTFNLDVQVGNGVYSGSSAPNSVAFFGTGYSCGKVEVTYDYINGGNGFSCIPEPGTFAAGLGALGCCGLGLIRRAKA
jgi:hypothetical protein